MKILHIGRKKMVMGLLAIAAVAMVLTITLLASNTNKGLSIYGVKVNPMADGSVQLLFDVGVAQEPYLSNVGFILDYNDEYMVLSDHIDNSPISTTGMEALDNYFMPSADIYKVDGEVANPYQTMVVGTSGSQAYSRVETAASEIRLNLALQEYSTLLAPSGAELADNIMDLPVGLSGDTVSTIDSSDGRVSFGTISFRVEAEDMPAIVAKFGDITNTETPETADGDYLLRTSSSPSTQVWSLTAYKVMTSFGKELYMPYSYSNMSKGDYSLYYDFDFENEIISVVPTAPNVILDAYQAYNLGTIDDIATILGKYSPMVTATYADGSKENFLMPWALANTSECTYDYGVFYYDNGAIGAPVTNYDPTGNEQDGITPDYVAQQYFYIPTTDDNHETTYQLYPMPITVTVAITPIEVLGLSAVNTERTYGLTYDFTLIVSEIVALELPTSARIITDILPDGATLSLDIPGWKSTHPDSVWPVDANLSTLLAENAVNGIPRWPVVDDWTGVSSIAQDDHLGVYGFEMATSNGATAKYTFNTSHIRSKYPWLTVEDNWSGDITSTRTIVKTDEYTDKADYNVSYVQTDTDVNGNPEATLLITKDGVDMASGSEFIVLMPDGTKIESSWFADLPTAGKYENRYYQESAGATLYVYEIDMNSGHTDLGYSYDAMIESLRRHINLGGWFQVSINEDQANKSWSDFIPVYVPPRDNEHTNDVEYHLVDINKNLLDYPSSTYVALPPGEYNPVTHNGEIIYVDDAGNETTDEETLGVPNELASRVYGVATTYDGITGAQPGLMNSFFVDEWNQVSMDNPTLATEAIKGTFPIDETMYQAFKNVINPNEHTALFTVEGPVEEPYDPTDPNDEDAPVEKIILTSTYEKATYTGENVSLVTYDTAQEGYTMRQEVTLTITNVGDLDIQGLYIDLTTDDDGDGGHFVMLREPASFLAVGQSTTFTLTYVYDLKAAQFDDAGSISNGVENPYLDTLFILSSRKNSVEDGDYLLDFDATFEVSADAVYHVIVKYDPDSGVMGTAGTVVGILPGDPLTMSVAGGSNTYVPTSTVYIGVNPLDEYTVKSITYTVGGYSTLYTPTSFVSGDGIAVAEVPAGWLVYTLPMPANDVEVLVVFEETLYSKLRFEDIDAFATAASGLTEAGTILHPDNPDRPEYLLYQKEFVQQDLDDASAFVAQNSARTEDEYLVQVGSAKSDLYDSSHAQYLVVIPYYANYAQLEATMRMVDTSVAGNEPVEVRVSMGLLSPDPAITDVIDIYDATEGATNGPTTHTSDPFLAPEMGESIYARISIESTDDGVASLVRSYYIEIHRSAAEIYADLNYGNSPYGLMMNDNEVPWDDDTTKESKLVGLEAFIDNGFSFVGLGQYIPRVVTMYDADNDRNMTSYNYWTEAWMKSDAGYSPDTIYEIESDSGLGDPTIYDIEDNLDFSPTALFVGINEAFYEPGVLEIRDNAGRDVPLESIVRYIDVTLLDETENLQMGRFSEPDVDDATRTKWRLTLGKASENDIAAGWAEYAIRPVMNDDYSVFNIEGGKYIYLQEVDDGKLVFEDGNPVYVQFEVGQIRPGIYDMIYSFTDFDQSTTVDSIIRPVVLLGQVGDVNADGSVDGDDNKNIFARVDDPLGYMVQAYSQANVFRYRQVDVNNDRNINNIDANEIATGTQEIIEFYIYDNFIPDNSTSDNESSEGDSSSDPGGSAES